MQELEAGCVEECSCRLVADLCGISFFYTTQGHLTYISKQSRQSPIWICPQACRYLESPSAEIPPTGDPRLGQVDS